MLFRSPETLYFILFARAIYRPQQSKEPLNKLAAALDGSFAATFRFENLEIHKVFLRFSNLNSEQNLSLTALADLFRASLDCHVAALLAMTRRGLFRHAGRLQHGDDFIWMPIDKLKNMLYTKTMFQNGVAKLSFG